MTADILDALPDKTPQNLDAEQALLGKLLLEPSAFRYVNPRLNPEHFYEPVHQRIYAAMLKLREDGKTVTPLVLKHYFDQDKGLSDIGGGAYLSRLAWAAVAIINVTDVSDAVIDLALRRELLTACHVTIQRLMHDEEFGIAAEAAAELMRAADAVAGLQEDAKFQDDYEQNLENLRRNHYAPIRCGSPCVTCETNVMRLQGAKRCAPSKATFPIMRSRP